MSAALWWRSVSLKKIIPSLVSVSILSSPIRNNLMETPLLRLFSHYFALFLLFIVLHINQNIKKKHNEGVTFYF